LLVLLTAEMRRLEQINLAGSFTLPHTSMTARSRCTEPFREHAAL
jgi:hypothetical protein